MPEGPSIVIAREEMARFAGRRIASATGNTTTVDKQRLPGQRIEALRSWGKHLLLEMDVDFALRIHFMMFGSFRIDEGKSWADPRLSLQFEEGGVLNFYTCSVRFIELPLDLLYDWTGDVMSPVWDAKAALQKLRSAPDMLACDALLDQDIFSGVGNIIKNEVLFRIRLHPLSKLGAIPAPKLRELVKEARQYSFDFYEWKKQFVLKKHWLAHTKRTCPRCDIPFHKGHLGLSDRRSFWCENCQVCYGA